MLRNSMDGTGEHYAEWNEPGSERQILYDLTYKWNLINKTNEQNTTGDLEIKNQLTVTRGEAGGRSQEKEGKGASKGKRIEDSWARTMGVGIDCV